MHATTRKQICRLGFLLACAAPTLLTLSCVAWRCSPFYRQHLIQHWQTLLETHTGASVRFESLRFSSRGTILLEGLELSDSETLDRIGTIRVVEIAMLDESATVLLQQPELPSASLNRLVDGIHRQLQTAHWPVRRIELQADDLTLHANQKQQDRTLSNLRCALESTTHGARASIDFYLAGLEMNEPARLLITRSRETKPPSTSWEFQSGPTPLPCTLLAGALPAVSRLGPQCAFRGSIWAMPSRMGWNVDLTGEFNAVDLDRLVTSQFPHKLSGESRIVLSRASMRQGRMELASGSFTSQPGVVSHSLLRAAQEWMGTRLGTSVESGEATLVAFRQFAFGFDLDQSGLRIRGQCPGQQPGVMLLGSQSETLMTSPPATLPAVSLVRTLAPESEIQVPATRETNRLLKALPIPSLVVPERVGARPPYSPLRLENE